VGVVVLVWPYGHFTYTHLPLVILKGEIKILAILRLYVYVQLSSPVCYYK
jgi:hypothetical protein